MVNPSAEEVIGQLPKAGNVDLDDALDAAEPGFKVWSRTAPMDRARSKQGLFRLTRRIFATYRRARPCF